MSAPADLDGRPGLFQAPTTPPVTVRPRIAEATGPVGLCLDVVRSGGGYALAGALLGTVENAATMLVPVAVGRAVDDGVGALASGATWAQAAPALLGWLAAVVALYLTVNVGFRFSGRLGWYAVQRAQYALSDEVLRRLVDVRGLAGPARAPGDLLTVATLDVHRTCLALYVAVYPVGQVVGIVVAALSLFLIHPALGWGVTVGAPLLLVVMAVAARPLQARSEAEQDAVADAAALAADLVAGAGTLRAHHALSAAARRYEAASGRALRRTVSARTTEAAFEGLDVVLSGLFAAAVAVAAAALALTGAIGVGGVIAAAGIAQVLLDPLTALVGPAWTRWAVALGSAARLLDLVGVPPRPDRAGRERLPDGVPVLEVDDADLPGGRLSLTVGPGEFVVLDLAPGDAAALLAALRLSETLPEPPPGDTDRDGRPSARPTTPTGESVAGATATGAGEEARPEGVGAVTARVRVGGVAVHRLDAAGLSEAVLVAPHDADLFAGTVVDNVLPALAADPLATRRPAAPEHATPALTRTLRHLDTAHATDLVDELPDGVFTVVGEGGRTLSGGQRQRVALARALAADPPILVLHDPTSSVDSVTEAAIAQRLRRARAGRSTIVVTSAPALHAVADRVVRVGQVGRNGRVAGSPDARGAHRAGAPSVDGEAS